jgi:hypothetical protein
VSWGYQRYRVSSITSDACTDLRWGYQLTKRSPHRCPNYTIHYLLLVITSVSAIKPSATVSPHQNTRTSLSNMLILHPEDSCTPTTDHLPPLLLVSHHPTPAGTNSSGTCDLIPSTICSSATLSTPALAIIQCCIKEMR